MSESQNSRDKSLLRDSSYDIIHQLEKTADFLYSFLIQQLRSTFEMLKSMASQS
jgi:hypothetical protein